MSTKPTGQLERTPIILEAERFRDRLADALNIPNWRVRGRSGDMATRRQIMCAFIHEAYAGKISLNDIATMCGYASRSRHTLVLYAVKKITDFISTGDRIATPLYKQARGVYRTFEFTEKPTKTETKRVSFCTLTVEQRRYIEGEAAKRQVSMSQVIGECIDVCIIQNH